MFTKEVSPFLMFDYAAPKVFPPTKRKLGVGEHPHRGFETVTIAFKGEVEHKDSAGNCGVIGPGDVQVNTVIIYPRLVCSIYWGRGALLADAAIRSMPSLSLSLCG